MNIQDTKYPEVFLIAQIDGTIRFTLDSPETKLKQIAHYIAEYEADQEARELAEKNEADRLDALDTVNSESVWPY